MPENNCKDYIGVTRAALDRWREDALRAGTPLPLGDSFTVEKSGVSISANYVESTETVTICIVNKPAFIPESMVWSIIESTFRSR
jgi:hypothetical protein